MLVDIKDKDALSRLSILSLRSYLNSRRWHNEGPGGADQRQSTPRNTVGEAGSYSFLYGILSPIMPKVWPRPLLF